MLTFLFSCTSEYKIDDCFRSENKGTYLDYIVDDVVDGKLFYKQCYGGGVFGAKKCGGRNSTGVSPEKFEKILQENHADKECD